MVLKFVRGDVVDNLDYSAENELFSNHVSYFTPISPARLSLISITFHRFAAIYLQLVSRSLAHLLGGMNAYSSKRMDERDFDRRLAAFSDMTTVNALFS